MAKKQNGKNSLHKEPMFSVIDPRGIEPEREINPINPRLDTLMGKTVNVINLHGGNEEAIESVGRDLKEAVPGCHVTYFRTDGGFGGAPLKNEDWVKMLDCDAAILGHNF